MPDLASWWADTRVRFYYRVANLCVRLHCYRVAAHAYGRVLRHWPDDVQARFHRAWNLLMVPSSQSKGVTAFQELLRDSPSASGFFLMGCGLQHEGRYAEAIDAFRSAIRMDDRPPADLYYNCGVCLGHLARWEEAADAFQHAVDLSPTDGEAWGNLGGVLAELGRWKEALPYQERAMRVSPSVRHGLSLASTLYELNRLDDAERVLRQVGTLDPRSIDMQETLAHVLAGQDRYTEALELARRVVALNPDRAYSRTVLAGVLAEAGFVDEALKEANVAVSIAATDPGSHAALGNVYMKMKDGAAALVAFERAAEYLGADAHVSLPAWLWCTAARGSALSLLGRHDAAMSCFEEVLRADREFFERWPEIAPHYQVSVPQTRSTIEGRPPR